MKFTLALIMQWAGATIKQTALIPSHPSCGVEGVLSQLHSPQSPAAASLKSILVKASKRSS